MYSGEQLYSIKRPSNEAPISDIQLAALLSELNEIYGNPKDLTPQELTLEAQLQTEISQIWDELLNLIDDSSPDQAISSFLASSKKQKLDALEEHLTSLYSLNRYEDLSHSKLLRLEEIGKIANAITVITANATNENDQLGNGVQESPKPLHILSFPKEASNSCNW